MKFTDLLERQDGEMFASLEVGNFEFSIQASRCHYCIPRETLDDVKDYSGFEVALSENSRWINPLNDARFDEIKEEFSNLWESGDHGVGGYIPTDLVQKLYDFCINLKEE